jgi:ribonuclease G
VFQEADLSVRVVRDIFSSEFERAYVDDPKQYHRLVSFFSRTAPDLVDRVELWDSDQPLFEAFGVDQVLDSTLSRRIDLPSGGYLVIDYAEALTVIDVNTGSFIGRGRGARLEDTITKTNLEAADEVVRQLRLRDIGGIIVIDFIDMARARNRDAVLKALRAALDEDRTKTFVVEISPLGLVEMTRQNVTDGVREIMTRPCPTCGGEGVIKSEETLATEFERRMREVAKATKAEALLIQMNPRVSAEFTRDDARALHAVEHDTGKVFVFEGSEGLPLDHFSVALEGSRDAVLERAVPFRVGEEVHVEVVEPHMYSPGDAVAKIDGYVISITGGGRYVGEKHLVRIEEAGRTAATATLVDVPDSGEADLVSTGARSRGSGAGSRGSGQQSRRSGTGSRGSRRTSARGRSANSRDGAAEPDAKSAESGGEPGAASRTEVDASGGAGDGGDSGAASDAADSGAASDAADSGAASDGLQSKPRRRGRRGGRRRSGAKAESASASSSSSD